MTNLVTTDDMDQLSGEFFKKSHRLVFSQLSLSAVEQDILALLLTKVSKQDWNEFYNEETKQLTVPEYAFTADVLAQWLGMATKRTLYATISKPAERLSSKTIGIRDDANKRFVFMPLFKKIQYQDGVLSITPNDELFKEIFVISKGHAQVPHKAFRALKGEYSKRLFAILCRFKQKGELKDMTLNDFHAYMGLLSKDGSLAKSSYARATILIERIIEPAIKEISEIESGITFLSCPLEKKRFGYSLVKERNKTVGIKFRYQWNQKDLEVKEEVKKPMTFDSPEAHADHIHCLIMNGDFKSVTKEGIDVLFANTRYLMKNGVELNEEFYKKLESCEEFLGL